MACDSGTFIVTELNLDFEILEFWNFQLPDTAWISSVMCHLRVVLLQSALAPVRFVFECSRWMTLSSGCLYFLDHRYGRKIVVVLSPQT